VTCGAIEENLANNLRMAEALRGQGYPVDLRILPDAHTMIGWRDAWTPGLSRLLDDV
jgi:enterochelin esterase family protein